MDFENFSHLSTITAVELEKNIEILYHMFFQNALVTLRVQVPNVKPILPSIIDIIPGAMLYEREIHDFFGVTFEGNPELSPLLLPDNWPEGVYPLKKWWTVERISKRLSKII
jgi:NADH:ubiquinone oxidoreductase subunit C